MNLVGFNQSTWKGGRCHFAGDQRVSFLFLPLVLRALHKEARESRNRAKRDFFSAPGISELDIVILLIGEEKYPILRPQTSKERDSNP